MKTQSWRDCSSTRSSSGRRHAQMPMATVCPCALVASDLPESGTRSTSLPRSGRRFVPDRSRALGGNRAPSACARKVGARRCLWPHEAEGDGEPVLEDIFQKTRLDALRAEELAHSEVDTRALVVEVQSLVDKVEGAGGAPSATRLSFRRTHSHRAFGGALAAQRLRRATSRSQGEASRFVPPRDARVGGVARDSRLGWRLAEVAAVASIGGTLTVHLHLEILM